MIVDGGGLAGRQCGRAVINCGCGGMTMGIGKGKVNRIRWPAFCGPTCRSCPASLQGPPSVVGMAWGHRTVYWDALDRKLIWGVWLGVFFGPAHPIVLCHAIWETRMGMLLSH
jgi:hypothetical protein